MDISTLEEEGREFKFLPSFVIIDEVSICGFATFFIIRGSLVSLFYAIILCDVLFPLQIVFALCLGKGKGFEGEVRKWEKIELSDEGWNRECGYCTT